MARKPTGYAVLEAAQSDIDSATTVEQLRIAQAVLLPLELGISLARTAELLGMTSGWVARARIRYIAAHNGDRQTKPRGGRRNCLLTPEDELKVVEQVLANRRFTWNPPVHVLRDLLNKKVGREVALSTAYNILNRVKKAKPHLWLNYQD
jgi:hypothetical protein